MKRASKVVLHRGASAPFSFGDAVRSYLLRRSRGHTTSVIAEGFAASWGRMPVEDVDTRWIDTWVSRRLKEVSSATARREATTLMAVLKMAVLSGRLASMPTLVRPLDGEPRLRALSEIEVEQLMAVPVSSEQPVWELASFMLETGARIGEALALEWVDVDLVAREVTFRSRKGTGVLRTRVIPLSLKAVEILQELKVVPRPFGWPSVSAASLATTALGVRRGLVDFTSHDLRRTFASRLLAKKVDVRVVAELLGHSSLAMVMRYAMPTRDLMRSAINY